MEQFTVLDGLVAPIDRANVDTDAIIPKQYLKAIGRTGFGVTLFDEWRYHDPGAPGMDHSKRRLRADFVLNQVRYAGAQILLARDNFGCGSSREHAPWALHEFGLRAIIAPSFADIFFSNCFKNGLLPIVLPADTVDGLFREVEATPGYRLRIDLPEQRITTPQGLDLRFGIDPSHKHSLVHGLDEIGQTLKHAEAIRAFEVTHRERFPWLFG
ncbi:MAG: 3-isopropylmalate dehydratase small subunit [Burkholderiales bacterium]|nr:3-isopropylmalate dehydratase small subunit [Burkholderiales bacterium]